MAKKIAKSNEVRAFNTFLRDVMYEGKATCQFNIDKRQCELSKELKSQIKDLGFNYQHKEHYYYKQTKSVSTDSKAYKALKAQLLEILPEGVFENIEMPAKSSPKTSKVAKKSSSKKSEIKSAKTYTNKTAKKVAKATSSQPQQQPQEDTSALAQVGKALESITNSLAILTARLDALEEAQ